jgi:hypothetical protein
VRILIIHGVKRAEFGPIAIWFSSLTKHEGGAGWFVFMSEKIEQSDFD